MLRYYGERVEVLRQKSQLGEGWKRGGRREEGRERGREDIRTEADEGGKEGKKRMCERGKEGNSYNGGASERRGQPLSLAAAPPLRKESSPRRSSALSDSITLPAAFPGSRPATHSARFFPSLPCSDVKKKYALVPSVATRRSGQWLITPRKNLVSICSRQLWLVHRVWVVLKCTVRWADCCT